MQFIHNKQLPKKSQLYLFNVHSKTLKKNFTHINSCPAKLRQFCFQVNLACMPNIADPKNAAANCTVTAIMRQQCIHNQNINLLQFAMPPSTDHSIIFTRWCPYKLPSNALEPMLLTNNISIGSAILQSSHVCDKQTMWHQDMHRNTHIKYYLQCWQCGLTNTFLFHRTIRLSRQRQHIHRQCACRHINLMLFILILNRAMELSARISARVSHCS